LFSRPTNELIVDRRDPRVLAFRQGHFVLTSINLERSHPQGGGPRTGDATARAIAALSTGRPQDAERIAGEALRAAPGNAEALAILGQSLLVQGRIEDAITALDSAGSRDPRVETQLALALHQAGRSEDALKQLKRAVKRRPPFAPAFHQLGALLFTLKRYGESIEVLERGRTVAPAMPELPIQLGHVFLAQRNPMKAKHAFAAALNIAPSATAALWGMGKAHQQIGESQEASGYFRTCLGLTPNDAGTWLNLGHSLVEAGNVDAGLECFRTAARGDRQRYYGALSTLVKASRGRFWLKPSDAERSLGSGKS
jgi:tetratricopeptide (TPR) repeat protein